LNNSKTDKLFSWKGATTPFQLLRNLENRLDIKTEGRGLHGFRRSFADKLFKNKFAIDRVQEIMRHRTINTTLEHYKSIKKKIS
jgi:integrase